MMISNHRAELSPAYILHSRKYRDTSQIVELLTLKEGRVAAVMRGARGKKKKHQTAQPFCPILVAYFGRSDLKTIANWEVSYINLLQGENALIGLYANELLVRLLGPFEVVERLFVAYQYLLNALVKDDETSQALRYFELILLEDLGYGITFDVEVPTGEPVRPDACYRYVAAEGFYPVDSQRYPNGGFRGDHLVDIANKDLSREEVVLTAKQVTRVALASLLGDKPLKSREVFKKYRLDMSKSLLSDEKDKS
ncbi:MAG: DNA repair protein RecO [Pseudomonadales bacterium]|nr:DNA repair protein RecO [Pseudomonadales bacterium]